MEKQLRILLLEDCRDDADLLMLELHSAGIAHVLKGVSNRDDFLAALADFKPDLVLSDHSLPDCTGIEAMNLARQHTPDLPFILVTGALGEELAVQTIKAGATDYILKNRLFQLVPAIMRAVRETEQRTHRRYAEKILRESEERFRQLAENINEVFWLTDPAGNQLIYVSPGYEKIWGRSCESLYANSRDWIEAIHPEDQERVSRAVPSQLRIGGYNEVYRILRPDGSLRWIQDRAFPIHNDQGQVYRIAGIAEDITARIAAEQAVRQAEANYRSIFENAIEGIFQTTPEGRYLSANPALARSLGYASPEELIGRVSDIGHQLCVQPETRDALKHRLETDGYVRDFENQIFRKDGSKIWISVNAHVVRDASGKVLYYEGTSQDVTRRKLAEAQVATLAHAVESTTEALCITDLEDRFTFVNRAFQKTYGYSEAEILSKTPSILFSKNNPPELMQEILEQTRLGGWRGEVLDQRKDGTEFQVFLSTSQIKDRLGHVLGLMGVAQDITQRKQAEKQIQQLADAMQSAQELICICDQNNKFTFANRAFFKTYGYTEEEILGQQPNFLYSAKHEPGLCDDIYRHSLNGGWSGELVNRRKDGSEFPISLSTSQIKDSQGRILGLVGVARDISQAKTAEKRTAAFARLGYRLSGVTAQEQAAHIILDVASELFGWDAGYVHLYTPAQDRIVPILTIDVVDGVRRAIEPSSFTLDPSPLMRQVMKEGARLINPGPQSSVDSLVRFGDTQRHSASMMYVPIHSSAAVIGLLSIQSYTADAYSKEDLVLLQALADYCGDALDRIKVLRESEEKFRSLFASAPIGIALHDNSGKFVHSNAAYQRMLGYTDEELKQLGVRRITHPDDIAMGQGLFADLRSGRQDRYHREKRYIHKDGHLVWAQSSASAFRNDQGELIYIISMVEDITERRKVLDALSQSERKLRLIAENTSDVIFAFDMERQPVYANGALKDLTGYTFGEIQQKKFINWVHPEDRERMLHHWDALFKGQAHSEVEFRLVTKKGAVKWCSSSWGPLLDEHGAQIGVQGRERDITERKQLEREVLESTANERRRIGHELHDGLGQYLAGIAFRAKALEQKLAAADADDAAEAKELAALISNAISQTRSLARGLDPVEVETIGLAAALQNLAAETRKFFNVICLFSCPEGSLRVDPQMALALYRIVQEAVHNAIVHGEAGRIAIELRTEGKHLSLEVKDDGCGFEPQPVHQGMGLRVMQYRARSIGASLAVNSRPAHGTQVCIRMPHDHSLQPRKEKPLARTAHSLPARKSS